MAKLRVMSVMAHQDDFEFEAAGLFAMLRKHYGNDVELKVLTTSRGASGHHIYDVDTTALMRDGEARASAALVGAEYENLKQLDGSHVNMQVFCDRNMLGGLWNAIRAFAPNYIIAPPVAVNPLAGIHIDHQHTAEAVRLVAYQLGVPNAYPTMNAPRITRFKPPVVLVNIDGYAQDVIWHFRVCVDEVKETKCRMMRCHKSQIEEWLPFVNHLDQEVLPKWDSAAWLASMEERHRRRNLLCGFEDKRWFEYFAVTGWGSGSWKDENVMDQVKNDFPFFEKKSE